MRLALVLAVATGCHVTARTELTRTTATRAEPHVDQARALPPTIALAGTGLRFVEPLVCPSDELAEVEPEVQRTRRPNLATFIVGVVAAGAGAVAAISAISGGDAGSDPLTYAGTGLVLVGLPLMVGPWIGNTTEREPGPVRTVRRAGGEVACGARAIPATTALLAIGDRQVYGPITADGGFQPSPFTWIDAFDPTGGPAFSVRAELAGRASPRVVQKVFDAGALAEVRAEFLAAGKLDASVAPLTAVPKVSAGTARVGRVVFGSLAALHILLPLANAGPGDAWQVRARISAASPELDGRMLYVGHLKPGEAAAAELWLPLSPAADAGIRTTPIELRFRLLDAHGTMPASSIEFRGAVIDDGQQ